MHVVQLAGGKTGKERYRIRINIERNKIVNVERNSAEAKVGRTYMEKQKRAFRPAEWSRNIKKN